MKVGMYRKTVQNKDAESWEWRFLTCLLGESLTMKGDICHLLVVCLQRRARLHVRSWGRMITAGVKR